MEEAQTAAQLEGMVSKKTQLSVLSIVANVPNEIEQMEKEQHKASVDPNIFGGAFGVNTVGKEE